MNKFHVLSISCAVLLTTGCDHYTTKLASLDTTQQNVAEISPAAGSSGDEMTFSQYLASEYYQLARYEQDEMYDYSSAKYYTNKAERLSKGQMVSPASLSYFDIKPEDMAELKEAREELIDAFYYFSTPENRYPLAIAQARFDCWVEQTSENKDSKGCQAGFEQAMSSLIIPDEFYDEEDYLFDLSI